MRARGIKIGSSVGVESLDNVFYFSNMSFADRARLFWRRAGAGGEKVAVIGRNGAGKSTFLKLVTHVIQPTAGSLEVKGDVAIEPRYRGIFKVNGYVLKARLRAGWNDGALRWRVLPRDRDTLRAHLSIAPAAIARHPGLELLIEPLDYLFPHEQFVPLDERKLIARRAAVPKRMVTVRVPPWARVTPLGRAVDPDV